MHIPDGYLSPATCAALYGASAPFWYVALERVKKALHTRLIPRLSLFAAFSFVIMMFNLPLPGGTTGHAVGIGLAAVVLGPWAAMLAVSVAIVVQALFFGDGGITAIGANCFNMAIAGAIVAYGTYRLIAGRSEITSTRRAVAAGIAGYCAVNVSALLAAIRVWYSTLPLSRCFGRSTVLPLSIERDDSGDDARPSDDRRRSGSLCFVGGHSVLATFRSFGFATGLFTAGGLWRRCFPHTHDKALAPPSPSLGSARRAPRPHATRHSRRRYRMGRVDGVRLFEPDRAHSNGGRVFSAGPARTRPRRLGAAFNDLDSAIRALRPYARPQRQLGIPVVRHVRRGTDRVDLHGGALVSGYHRGGLFERNIKGLHAAMERALYAENSAAAGGLLQAIDPRVKVAGLFALIAAVALASRLWTLAAILAVATILSALSRISPRMLATRVWASAFLFSAAISIPALFLTPGVAAVSFPNGLAITAPGLRTAAFHAAARGIFRNAGFTADLHDAVDACAQSAARLTRARAGGGDPGNDVPLHSAAAGNGARDVRGAQEPYRGRTRSAATADGWRYPRRACC